MGHTCHWVNLWVGSKGVLHTPLKRHPAQSVHDAIAQHLELQANTAGEASDAGPCHNWLICWYSRCSAAFQQHC